MSLASTVSSVIEVPATHSSGVEPIWPAWTDAISSSVEAKIVPPTERDERLVRLDQPWTAGAAATRRPRAPRRRDDGRLEASRAADEREPHADGRVDRREQDHDRRASRWPASGRTGRAGCRRSRPSVFDGKERARVSDPACRCLIAQQRRCGRERDAEDDRDGQDDEQRDCRTGPGASAIGSPGSSCSGRPMTPTSPMRASAATAIWVMASSRSGSRRRGRMTLKIDAPIAMPVRKTARIT